MKKFLFNTILSGLVLGCSSSSPLENFDSDSWKSDHGGCSSKRKDLVTSLMENKSELLGNGQTQIKEWLGNPDQHQLYKRNQKFFIYYLEPGPSCKNNDPKNQYNRLEIRFNALGKVNEITVYN